ncbi:hypothetical protein SAMN05216371_2469 [Streptomyces sp. TLI_053]|uniref:hypothetical protein n=1 Tax=Streptomyces sp. TLI_053 TaxID=1855352 RepID=UPI00087C2651|nr:hypothetical protein [Streptomyces sp. TLI_053]SDT48102.1 hypothetical protein SAMN05216371_2469 [Streptomyces sp. TLI_053]
MTLENSTPPPGRSAEWAATLAGAFGEILGRPLDEYGDQDARYGAYYGGNFLDEAELDHDPVWVGRAALAGEEAVATGDLLLTPPGDTAETELVFDAGRSLFWVDPRELPDALAAFGAELADAVAASEDGQWRGAVLGADLGRIAGRHGVDLASADLPRELWTLWQGRIASGDTLLDALCAATGLTAATSPDLVPAGLGDTADEVEEEAHDLVAGVTDPALRDYLAAFCDEESHDLALVRFAPADDDDDDDDQDGDEDDFDEDDYDDYDDSQGGTVVVRWDGAVDQYEVTVRRVTA